MAQISNIVPIENSIFKELSFLKPKNVQEFEKNAPLVSKFTNIISADELQPLETEWRSRRASTTLDFNEPSISKFWAEVASEKQKDGTPFYSSYLCWGKSPSLCLLFHILVQQQKEFFHM